MKTIRTFEVGEAVTVLPGAPYEGERGVVVEVDTHWELALVKVKGERWSEWYGANEVTGVSA